MVLKVQLPKTNLVRCGNWEAPILTEEQIEYAALDAWVSYEIYDKFKSIPTVHQKVSGKTRADSFVAIHLDSSARNSVAAFGFLCDANASTTNNERHVVANSNGAAMIKVIKVLIPGFPVDCHDDNLTLQKGLIFPLLVPIIFPMNPPYLLIMSHL